MTKHISRRTLLRGAAASGAGWMALSSGILSRGASPNEKLNIPDSGYQNTFAFRTPSLRNLRFTFPYMHNGKLTSIHHILELYEDISGGESRNSHVNKDSIDPLARALDLKVKDMSSINSFLLSLNDENFDKEIPKSVPSGLPVGGNIGE